MIGYAMLGSNNLAKSFAFYDALLGVVGGKRAMPLGERGALYASQPGRPMLGIVTPYDGGPAVAGNGPMVALAASDKAQVDMVYGKAIELGATSEGEPGPRGPDEFGFYGAYFRDPDGNKLAVFHWTPAASA